MNVCTIVAKNYVAFARTLGLSLREHHADATLTVLILDDFEEHLDPDAEPFRIVRPTEIGCDDFDEMAARYTVLELSTAVKPWLLRTLLQEADHAVYLDPDIQITGPLDEIRERAVDHGIVLTPHNLTPIPRDGLYPQEQSILIAGAYNLGFIGLGRGAVAEELLDWWSERLEADCTVDVANGLFVDQKWIDLVPGIWPTTYLLRDPGYNVAYWNLHARHIKHHDDGTMSIDGHRARFLHFSGYDPTKPERLSKHQNRIGLKERPDVRRAADRYGAMLLEQDYVETTRWPYGIARLGVGVSRSGEIPGINVVGYLNAELGVGEVARQAIGALDAVGAEVVPVGIVTGSSREQHGFDHPGTANAHFAANLICVNADMLPTVAAELGPAFFDGRRTVGWWWWEVESFPTKLRPSFDLVDEVWAGSAFVADLLARVATKPVAHIPTPVTMRPGVEADRRRLRLPDGFLFLYVFDFNSQMRRKNPLGLLDAYRRAFPDPHEGVTLVLKTINRDRHPDAAAAVDAAIGERSDIIVIDEYLDSELKDVLIASCDCYVSLHRSEGFGMTLAEAMLLGKPVIATDYSGSTDYLHEDTGFPVRCKLTTIGPDAAPYPAEGRWAEPDLDHAAELMRAVIDDPETASQRAAQGRAYVMEHHSATAAGAAMAERLRTLAVSADAVGSQMAVLDPPELPDAQRARTETLAALRSLPPASRSASKRVLQKLARRLTRSETAHRREIDEALWWSIESEALVRRVETESALTELWHRLQQTEGRVESASLTARRAASELKKVAEAQRTIAELQTRQASTVDALDGSADDLLDLVAATHAEPHMEGRPFVTFDSEDAGSVLGYRDAGNGRDDGGYHAFENVFRGSEELIRDRMRTYVPLLEDHAPVLDIGPGRGELLDILRDAGIGASGIDLDDELVAYAQRKGHEVAAGDAVPALERMAPGTLGAITAMQVVEHLPADDLQRLLVAGHAALRPGGTMILETVNPHSAWALKAFWVDLTHQHPIFPEVLLQLCRQAGFSEAYVFSPNGSGDWERDRTRAGEYAVVARP